MKLTFLGTSAGEFYPAMWCHCPNCTYARQHGGRNLRRHSCALLDDDVMIDLSAHAFITAGELGLDITGIRTLLVTHDHADHFDPLNIITRIIPSEGGQWYDPPAEFDPAATDDYIGPRFTQLPLLDIWGHESVYEAMHRGNAHIGGYDPESRTDDRLLFGMQFTALSRGQTIAKPGDDLTVTAVTSRHAIPGHVYNYIIQRGGRTLLYASDCGGYDDDMLALLKRFRYDCVVFEGTFGLRAKHDAGHMDLEKNIQMLAFFTDNDLWTGTPNFVLTHMAPHSCPPYDLYRPVVEAQGMRLAYDGMVLDI